MRYIYLVLSALMLAVFAELAMMALGIIFFSLDSGVMLSGVEFIMLSSVLAVLDFVCSVSLSLLLEKKITNLLKK